MSTINDAVTGTVRTSANPRGLQATFADYTIAARWAETFAHKRGGTFHAAP